MASTASVSSPSRLRCTLVLGACVVVALAACAPKETYREATMDASGRLHAVTSTNRVVEIAQDSGQAGIEQVALSPDRRTVGWVALYPTPGATYPIPLRLVLLPVASGRTVINADLPIWQWAFTSGSKQVVLRESPLHGDSPMHFELRDARSGTVVSAADVIAGTSAQPPSWARAVVPTQSPPRRGSMRRMN